MTLTSLTKPPVVGPAPDDTVIVVADDDRHIRRLLGLQLTRPGVHVVEVDNGEQALEECRRHGVDLAILDVNMPGLTGFEVLEQLQAEPLTALVPVLLLTASAVPGSAATGLGLGARDYLRKPFDLDELQARVDAAVQLGRRTRALAASEARYRALVDHQPGSGVLLLDRDLRVVTVGGYLFADRGYATEEMVGRLLEDILPPAHAEFLLPRYRAAQAGQPSGTFEFVPSPGLHYLIDALPLDYGTGRVEHVLIACRDVTALTLAERERERAESGYQAAFEDAPVGMAQVSADGRLQRVNPALCAMVGYSRADLEGRDLLSLLHPDDAWDAASSIDKLLSRQSVDYRAEGRYINARAETIWVAVSSAAVLGNDGEIDHMLMHFLDITDRKNAEEQLQQLANHDPLTGLLNRRGFEAELERQATLVERYGPAGALLLLDLDHFKQVNDTLGHSAGDQLIVAIADVLRRTVRDSDVVARIGGDEFAVILPEDGRLEAEHVAEKILHATRGEVTMLDGQYPRTVTASIGVAMFDDPGLTGKDVLINADVTMYDAKQSGRDRSATFSAVASGPRRTKTQLTWVDRINTAFGEDRLALYAQPIVDLSNGRINRFELLLRMLDESGDAIGPAPFLDVAERAGLVGRIDRWVTAHAIELLANPELDADTVLTVNLSAITIGEPDLLAHLERRFAETGADPRRLVLEITETAAVTDIRRARGFVERLAAIGCQFAIDDFGAGFGNFYYLKHLPFDYIKIDGEFISNCVNSRTDQLVIASLVTIARGLGKQTIAEFVSDEEALGFLRDQGVDYAQGYHIGRPGPVETILREATHLVAPVIPTV